MSQELPLLPHDPQYFLDHLRSLARLIQQRVLAATRAAEYGDLARAIHSRGGDVIYALDVHAEEVLQEFCRQWGEELPFVLIAEGIENGRQVFPDTARPTDVRFTLIVDPVDGTRGLMYGKRSAWFLGAIAAPPDGNYYPTLADIQIALQAELPTPRAAAADTLWAVRDQGLDAETLMLSNGTAERFVPRPSTAHTVAGGFATICKFFPGTMSAAAELEEALFLEILGPPYGTPQVFDDEYISTGGQLYELTVGRDRFVADLRPLLIHPGNSVNPLCCHPYDLCTWIIAQEAGVQITSGVGGSLIFPLDTETPVSWIGYANEKIRESIELPLQRLLEERMENL